MGEHLVVLGAGGHAKVVIATARAAGLNVVAVLDDDLALHGKTVLDVPVAGRIERSSVPRGATAILAIGSNSVRRALADGMDCRWAVVVHPSAVVDPTVALGGGTVIFAGVVVQPGTSIGSHVILNTACSVDHDCVVGDFAHLAPGVRLAGDCEVATGSFLGIGAVVIPGIRVGPWSTVGAGAVVIDHVPGNVVAVGVPARVVRGLV